MGIFNLIVDVSSAAVKVAVTPIALVGDIGIKVVTGQNAGLAEGAVKSAVKDLGDAVDEIVP